MTLRCKSDQADTYIKSYIKIHTDTYRMTLRSIQILTVLHSQSVVQHLTNGSLGERGECVVHISSVAKGYPVCCGQP